MSDTRSQIGSALEGKLTPEQIKLLFDEILQIKKGAHAEVNCKHCGRTGKYQVEVSDAKAVTGALVDLANQAWGRPQDDKAVPEGITFVRRIVYGGEEEAA